MLYLRPVQQYHSRTDIIWPDNPFKAFNGSSECETSKGMLLGTKQINIILFFYTVVAEGTRCETPSGNMKLSSTKNAGTGVNVYIKSKFPLFRDEEMHLKKNALALHV